MCGLAVILLFLPSAAALDGENPADTVDRLTDQLVLLVASLSFFAIVVGVLLIVFGPAGLRAIGSGIIVGVIVGNIILLSAPWLLTVIAPGS